MKTVPSAHECFIERIISPFHNFCFYKTSFNIKENEPNLSPKYPRVVLEELCPREPKPRINTLRFVQVLRRGVRTSDSEVMSRNIFNYSAQTVR